VVHAKELKRTTNTGRLAVEALENSALKIRGAGREALDLTCELTDSYESVLLYPGEDSISLADFKPEKPVQLIVPDGNWRQAAKVGIRHPELKALRKVRIPQANSSQAHLRKEHFEEGRSTLEAIAEAIRILEGDAAAEPLFKLFRAKLSATLSGRPLSATVTPG
jgi:DTW domain-containing protein YfiP